ncbi:MAG TPA: hypothetical protein EYP07_08275 [Kiloniellaceae bacterium]|nr:hypothetical protein [Kiloniellaceae bacterium]
MDLDGKTLALILCDESDGDIEAYRRVGTLHRGAEGYALHWDDGTAPLDVQAEWLERIKPVADAVKDILLDADLVLSLSVGAIPDDVDPSELLPTGLRIPPGD